MDAFSDLGFFALLMKQGSFAGAAQQMGVTAPAVSKRLSALEKRLGVRLLNRTTRRISLTPEGETYLAEGAQVLADLEALERKVTGTRAAPKGLLRVGATLGFGRRHVAPALSRFARRYPDVEVQLDLSDKPVNVIEAGHDVLVHIGEPPDVRLAARRLACNRRLLCAAPAYLSRTAEPQEPRELMRHACLFIRQHDETFGTWHLHRGDRHETVKVRGPLCANDGESALGWALDGHGIVLRSEWDVAPMLRSGRLRRVLAEWAAPTADVYALFQARSHLPAKTRALIDFLVESFRPQAELAEDGSSRW